MWNINSLVDLQLNFLWSGAHGGQFPAGGGSTPLHRRVKMRDMRLTPLLHMSVKPEVLMWLTNRWCLFNITKTVQD